MSNYSNTKATIAANVYTNHNNEVTAAMVKAGINSVVDALIAGGFLYKGVATTSTNPGTPDANVFYIATAPGTYTNFGSLVVNDGEVCILKYNGSWSKEVTGAATSAQVSALGQKVIYLVGMGVDATEAGATTGDYYYNTYYGDIRHLISGGIESINLEDGAVYVMGGELFSCINGAFAKLNDVFGDWQLVTIQIGSIQASDGAEVTNDKRLRTGAIYGKHYFILPTGYIFQTIAYYNISTGNFDSLSSLLKQYVHIDKSGCYARLVISRTDYGVVSDADIAQIRIPTRIDDIVKTEKDNYSSIITERLFRDDVFAEDWQRINPEMRNKDRARSAETTSWGAHNGFNIARVTIPDGARNVRIILKNNTIAFQGGYIAFYFSADASGSNTYIQNAGEQSVLTGEKADISTFRPIPTSALYLYLCTDISANVGDIINNNNLFVSFDTGEDAVAVERLIMPAITTGYLVNSDTGELIEASGYPYVDIDLTGKNYKTIRTYVTAFSNPRGYGFFFSDNSWTGVRPTADGEKIIEVPPTAVRFRFCWNPALKSPSDQYFYVGIGNSLDEAYKKAKKNDIFFQFLPDFNLSNIPTVTIPQITSNLSDIYGRYDALLAAYPNYITKIDCSDADSVLGVTRPAELAGMPIYIYKFSPVLTRVETFDVRPKAMIISGTHSDEKLGIYTTWQMMKIICENWTTIHDAQILRTMADIYVMPLLNPWGFVNANNTIPGVPAPGRQNYNGVNLNRNFPTLNWTLTAVGTNYSGASAGSEYETKIAMYYIQQLKPDFFLDAHTGNMNIYGAMGAFETPNVQKLRAVAYSAARTATTQLMLEDISFGENPDQSLFDVGGFSATGEMAAWVFENICDLAFLSEQCIESRWLNGVLTNTSQASYTDTIFRENLQATYNLLLRCLYAAAISK